MLCGGTLALLASAGAQVHFLVATRGEGGEVGEPPLTDHEHLGQVREDEMHCAVQALGGTSLTFLGYEDPRVGEGDELYAYTEDVDRLTAEVVDIVRNRKIEAIITHGSNGEYGHPAHRISHQAARTAVMALHDQGLLLYTAAAAFPEHPRPKLTNPDDPADLVLDIAPVLSQKVQAALCHRTQHPLFTRQASQDAGRQVSVPEVIIPLEGIYRAIPPANGVPSDPLAVLLQPYLYRGNRA